MFDETDNLLRDIGAELVFGLVAPAGADLERLEADLIDLLGRYGYVTNPIRLSALLRSHGVRTCGSRRDGRAAES